MNTNATSPSLMVEEDFLPDAAALFFHLRETIHWDESLGARKTASFGVPYNYARMEYDSVPFTHELLAVAERLASRLGIGFNNCLLNFYESGANTMGFHSDETTHLIPGTGVAIVSLGSPHTLTFRLKRD
ncbi:MAG: alpha-ketoglutarate-dependent dioxygenase AlkB [Verrucomicrobiales bacterium]